MATWETFEAFLEDVQQMNNNESRRQLVNELMREHNDWPWINGNTATFVYFQPNAHNVAVNLDTIDADPPFLPMTQLAGTDLWYAQHAFEPDDLLDYLIVVDDPMTPLKDERNLLQRIQKHWQMDMLNPRRLRAQQIETSVLRMPLARPFPNWEIMPGVQRGSVDESSFRSAQMGGTEHALWVYTPLDYDRRGAYPLLILLDGQWMNGPMQVPAMADALIKHKRLQPLVIAMLESGNQANRLQDFVSNDQYATTIVEELLPQLQQDYAINTANLGIGGVDLGAIAAAYTALNYAQTFASLIMLSPPLGRGRAQDRLLEYAQRFENEPTLPHNIFQSVGRYEIGTRFYKPALALAGILQRRQAARGDINHRFVELGSGHGLVPFRAMMPEALAHSFPGQAFGA